jgi:alanine racemase
MLKADAYGLGAVEVARALEPLDPWGYGVATAAEGAVLRDAGIRRSVLVFSPGPGELDEIAARELTPGLGSVELVRRWRAIAEGRAFHVQVDTGMGRGGIRWEALGEAAPEFSDTAGFEGLFTHFHSADVSPASVKEQWARFEAALARLERRPRLVHAANSAAALAHPETAGDLVRPGIFLYGGRAGGHQAEPVVSWRARVAEAAWHEAGATVSYGATWRAAARTGLAVVSAGYADGLPWSLSSRGEVLLCGRRLRIAGRITMDLTVVECGDWLPEQDSVATLLGTDGHERLTVDELAETAGTISYEVLTRIGPRVPRVYRNA